MFILTDTKNFEKKLTIYKKYFGKLGRVGTQHNMIKGIYNFRAKITENMETEILSSKL